MFQCKEWLLFFAEPNWQDSSKINRITIVSPLIQTQNGIHVGQHLASIKQFVSRTIPSVPDGYFELKDAKNPKINYLFDIENYPKIAEGGIFNIDELPSDLAISSIVLQ